MLKIVCISFLAIGIITTPLQAEPTYPIWSIGYLRTTTRAFQAGFVDGVFQTLFLTGQVACPIRVSPAMVIAAIDANYGNAIQPTDRDVIAVAKGLAALGCEFPSPKKDAEA